MNLKLKHYKYKILSRLPGAVGRRYSNKRAGMAWYYCSARFDNALTECRGQTCIDVGANVGEFTKKMATVAGKVIAFEPDPDAFAVLKASTAEFDNVELNETAAGTADRVVKLYRGTVHPTPVNKKEAIPGIHSVSDASTMFKSLQLGDPSNYAEVQEIDLIGFMRDLNTDIGLIKIDAEGAEVPILEELLKDKALLGRIRYVFVETHERLFPQFSQRYEAIRAAVEPLKNPVFDLNWH